MVHVHNDISEILFSEQDLAIRVRELGEAITRDYADVAGDAGIVVVSILRGGAVFTCDLIRAIDLPLKWTSWPCPPTATARRAPVWCAS